jgi:hypothetical protein
MRDAEGRNRIEPASARIKARTLRIAARAADLIDIFILVFFGRFPSEKTMRISKNGNEMCTESPHDDEREAAEIQRRMKIHRPGSRNLGSHR